ncbi:hypothetical protein BJ508DRAFT_364553 [Ascobolus immersus RN42]|uniref:Uncharacterized protein n=1 Tax=Ascobolus immersus RN42 TaxID=1160509 RepID=A0A3N4I693_ASCIM|nr:hypothetical protein BJ508DRAFT_364553 [Ascobolus immersus RN42]
MNSFTIEASYFEFNCDEKGWISRRDAPTPENNSSSTRSRHTFPNGTIDFSQGGYKRGTRDLLHIAILPNQAEYNGTEVETGQTKRTEPLRVAVRIGVETNIPQPGDTEPYGETYQFICDITEPRVQANISCAPNANSSAATLDQPGTTAGICEVSSLRADPRYSTIKDTFTTQLDTSDGNTLRAYLFTRIGSAGRSTQTEDMENSEDCILPLYYLQNPTNMMGWDLSAPNPMEPVLRHGMLNPSNISLKEFQDRFTLFFNGFFHASQTPYLRSVGIDANRTFTDRWTFKTQPPEEFPKQNNAEGQQTMRKNIGISPNTSKTVTEILRLNLIWFSVYMVSCVVLLSTILSGFVYQMCFNRPGCAAPDILTYFSSLTRDNPYVRASEDPANLPGSGMGGAERAKLLGDMRVRLGDVEADDDEAGHIALFREDLYEDVKHIPRLGRDPERKYR